MTQLSVRAWVHQHLGLPGRSWAPTPRMAALGLAGAVILLVAGVALGSASLSAPRPDPSEVLLAFALLWWTGTHQIPVRERGVPTFAVLDTGVLVVLLGDHGPARGLGLWLLLTLSLELLRQHFVALALANAAVSLVASAAAAVALIGLPGPLSFDPEQSGAVLIGLGLLAGLVHTATEGIVTETCVGLLATERTRFRWRDSMAASGFGMVLGAMGALCVSSAAPAMSLVALSVPMVLLVTLAHSRAARASTLARDSVLVEALTDLARADDPRQIDDILVRSLARLVPSADCTVVDGPPRRGRRSTWLPLGEHTAAHRWVHVELRPYEVVLPAEERNALEPLALVAGAAIERVETQRRMAWQAEHDPLTGLLNRSGFWQRHVQAEAPERTRCAVLLVDLDGFKPINDTHGHAVGDELLRMVADGLRRCAGHDAVIARWGGDEFVVRLELDNDETDLVDLGQRIVHGIEEAGSLVAPDARLSASVGYASTPEAAHADVLELLHRADSAMYAAKRAGKATVRGSRAD